MKQIQANYIISVDSETGFYWYGEHILRTKALIKSAIEKVIGKKYEQRS